MSTFGQNVELVSKPRDGACLWVLSCKANRGHILYVQIILRSFRHSDLTYYNALTYFFSNSMNNF